MSRLRLLFTFAACLAANSVLAQGQSPVVEVTLSQDAVAVGEPLEMRVSVFVPTWFAKAPQFPSFEISNAVTRLPPNNSRSTSKRVGRDSWSGVTRRYEIYPLIGANFRIESQSIIVYPANPGSDPIRVEVPTGDIAFRAFVPAGAESLTPYVAGTRLEVTRRIEGDTSTLAVGDAVVATYTAELEGLSSMFLPELLPEQDIDGVSIYPKQPTVEDDDGVARRTEKVTYIFNAGGDFAIPGASVEWWNRDTSSIETASVTPLILTIDGPLPAEQPAEDSGAERNWLALIIAAAVLYWLLRRAASLFGDLRAQQIERERIRRASEPYAWEQARKALGGKNPRRAHESVIRWLAKLESGLDTRRFALQYGDAELAAEIEKLNRALYTESNESANLGMISRGLSKARRSYLAETDSVEAVLPPLNP